MKTEEKIILAVVALIGGSMLFGSVAKAAGDVANAVNPANNENIFNQGFSNWYGGSIGSDIYDWLHDDKEYSADQNSVNYPFNYVGQNYPINSLQSWGYSVGADLANGWKLPEKISNAQTVYKAAKGGFNPFDPLTWF